MLTIRLARVGTNKKPSYRIIICERGRDNYGRLLENLGTYNTFTKDLKIDAEKVKAWIAKGAQLSATLNNLFLDKKIITAGKKVKSRRGNTEKIIKKREEVKKKGEEDKKKAEEAVAKASADKEAAAAAAQAAAVEAAKAPAPAVPVENISKEEPKAV
jgi:small subunit ribosomal protein S16